MNVRPYEDTDHALAATWWEGHGWPVMPKHALPDNGFVAEHEGEPVGVVWLYLSDSTLAWIEFLVCDPKISPKVTLRAVHDLIQAASETARDLGCGIIFTSVKHEGLIRAYKKKGYQESDTEMTNLTLAIQD